MKHGKRPTVAQCKLMTKWNLDAADWLVVKDTPETMTVVRRGDRTQTVEISKREVR